MHSKKSFSLQQFSADEQENITEEIEGLHRYSKTVVGVKTFLRRWHLLIYFNLNHRYTEWNTYSPLRLFPSVG